MSATVEIGGQVRTFDWRPRHDPRSLQYGVAQDLDWDAPLRDKTWRRGPVLDQGSEGACVGFGCSGEAAASPVRVKGVTNASAIAWYREAQKIDEWPGECVDMETQCLTRSGWVNGDELRVGDEILTFDIETEMTRWAIVEKVHRYDRTSYRVWGARGFAAAVTDNHRWPVRLRANGTGDRFPRPFRMTATAEWRSGDEFLRAAPCSDLRQEPKWDDDLVELIGWVMCEGHYRPATRRGTGVVVAQKVHLERVAALMERLGVPPGSRKADGCHTWEISGELSRQIREIAPGRAPRIDWLASLTLRQLRLLLDVCTLADGNTTPAAGVRQSRDTFAQKPGPILDSWLAATAMAGQAVQRARRGKVETWTLRRSSSVEVRKLKPSEYVTGPVWCPQTEAGTFVARRDGSVFITGNSYSGTSVLAGMKIGVQRGYYSGYHWCFDVDQMARTVVQLGPVVIGVPWRSGMYDTGPDGLVEVSGSAVGGHCLLVIGYRLNYRGHGPCFVWLNSWGTSYGLYGRGYVRRDDMAALLARSGECAVPHDRSLGRI